ncbi:glycoside hydrolase family 78 protein [Maribacter antarcticus]|uniref:glycoside hydrolase family 78 protein n=1 Tax=Maribacter antarcticus TaxID=505250 RepID=UPI0006876324|nr:glycoside hydrolase family 78 protein [Maribacter antarcticus]
MKNIKVVKIIFLLFSICYFSCAEEDHEIELLELKCEYLKNPIGIDVLSPRLSWKIKTTSDDIINQEQVAYQILVATSPEKLSEVDADLWNTGQIISDSNKQITYQGTELNSKQKCYWKVKIWNNESNYTAWSEVAKWSMGLLEDSDWSAEWIGNKPDLAQKGYKDYLTDYRSKNAVPKTILPVPPSSPMLRKRFSVTKEVSDAMLYVSALGYYEIGLNGNKVGNHVLSPEWTDYNKRVQYQTYDVTQNLENGENVLFAILGDGWYLGMLGPTKWHTDYPRRGVYGNDRRLIAQLVINYRDGTKEVIDTDESWKINSDGYIISADNFLGQKIDARKIPSGWRNIKFDDVSWTNAFVDSSLQKNLEAQKNEPIRVYKEFEPVEIMEIGDIFIVDFGQNLTGWTKLEIQGNRGASLKIRHGEMLNEDGTLYTANLAAAIQEDDYILSGKQDVFEPSFTYHGFRFIEVSGLNQALDKEMISALAIGSDPEITGVFECSNPKLNQLWHNIVWTQRNNMTSVPTDCPQRDERMGWMGDAQVFCQTSMFSMDMAAFYTKWIKDIRDAQSERGTFPDIAPHTNKPDIRFSNAPAWADAGVIIPWRMYQNYGDKEILIGHYDAMKRYLENIKSQNPDHIWLNDVGNNYGDWLNANTIDAKGYSNERGEVPKDVFATAFYANSVKLFTKIAVVLDKKEDAKTYQVLYENIRKKFNEAFVDKNVRIKGNTQSAYALALNFDLLPKEKQTFAFEHLIECIEEYDYRISTGFVTTIMLMKELVRRGRVDIAYNLIESERFPSWIYSIDQGATTIWERWDGYVKGRGFQNPGMNSFNHYSIGAVGEWMYRIILGINPSEEHPGFKHFTIKPQQGGTLTWAKGSYKSINGLISSEWRKDKKQFKLDVEIPINTSATIILPVNRNAPIKLNSKSLAIEMINSDHNMENETAIDLGSGKYSFEVSYYE